MEVAMSKMLAMMVPSAGAKLTREQRDIPKPGPGEVRIRVQACGVCHSDSLTVAGRIPGFKFPRIPAR
jgi:D-arabinose 1-dehydrogenase-like Zn-dependent alcohol dehydrogenase